jgi:hypothetical protein
LQDKNITNTNIKQVTNSEQEQQDHYQMMNSDDESDNDSELLETLAQFHGIIHTPRLSVEINQTNLLQNQNQQYNEEKFDHLISNSNVDEKQNLIVFNNDDKNQMKTYERNEEKKSSTCFSLTSLTSSVLFNDDESHSTDIILDSDASSSLIMSNYESNDLQIIKKDKLESPMLSSFDIDVIEIVEKLVSNALQLALDEINESHRQIEQLIEQILSEAIYEIYNENQNLSTENLELIINSHNQTNKQILDPFDQKFHSIWISHFQTPDDNINENSSLLIDPFDLTNTDNDLTRYPLTAASVKNINTNDSYPFQDDFNLYTVIHLRNEFLIVFFFIDTF